MIVHEDSTVTLHAGDCLDVLRTLPDASVDAVVTDPPYGLANTDPAHVAETIIRWVNGERDYLPGGKGFMGKAWDAFVPPVAVWDECLRVLKPGGHALVFAGSRTMDLMTLGMRLAGFEVRDGIAWLYGSGFPKSLDVSKAIDKAAGAEREVVGDKLDRPGYHLNGHDSGTGALGHGISSTTPETRLASALITAPATDDARTWQGWGTALKPAFEPIVVARKPLTGTVAANVLRHGTGALNIDACRIEGEPWKAHTATGLGRVKFFTEGETPEIEKSPHAAGRWPANVVLDESQAAALDAMSGTLTSGTLKPYRENHKDASSFRLDRDKTYESDANSGGASRFFKVVTREDDQTCSTTAAANGAARHSERSVEDADSAPGDTESSARGVEGCADLAGRDSGAPVLVTDDGRLTSRFTYTAKADAGERVRVDGIAHPTVKPLTLMRWLVRLVTPPGGVVLEPFAGSGTTVEACILEGFRCVAIERETDYLPLILQRINRRRDPVAAVKGAGEDGGLFDLLEDGGAA